ncbi:uncharacterized protein LOC132219148 isoform X6 [Myotis daubentonii]|uniref:uncharacterized protein LOC132219148 isoform X6 n=1 Tax=Myotis daubentonii TaxID=98922 RepID=UPI0028731360|nr:uncharacterized protein LOC132219148 isoform X6 [Myotis daubentonii]
MAGGPCSRPGTSGTAPRIATGTWTEEAEGTGRTQGPQVGGCPRKMRSRQPRRLGEEGVRRLPPAPPDENFRSERGVGDPGELGRRCVLRGNLLVDYTSAWFSGPEMSFVLGPARSGLTRRRPRFARM